MNNILLISEDTLKTYSNLNDNTFGKWILPAIKESQEMGLMPIIGECLYNKICELVADGSINDVLFTAYKDLLDDKIQPYLIYKTLSNIIPILNAKMANIGTVLTNDEHVINLTQGESDLLKTYYSERCDFYTKRLQDFIKNNQSAFPEIACGCGNMQPNLESSENSVGVWLGGSRGKKIGGNKCGCSSTEVTCGDYQSGFTDGVEFQKRKLAITGFTENGRYIREDGYSEVTVDVPQTGHTDEELEEAYDNGYGDGENYQKSLLSAITITQNGDYERADGYSAITVNVSGQSASLITTAITSNGEYFPAQGYDGFSSVEVNVPSTGYTEEEYQEHYSQGYRQGQSFQKSLMTSTAVTENGTYRRTNGFSAFTVNVPQTGTSGTEITVAENVYLNEYGTYYFTYDSATSIDSMIVHFGNPPTPTGASEYLTFRIITGGNIKWITKYPSSSSSPKGILYSKNNGATWNYIASTTAGTIINVSAGDVVIFKGDNASYNGNGFAAPSSVSFTVEGNIMSLIDSTGFATATTLTASETFSNLFEDCAGLTSVENLKLPTTLTAYCYSAMFRRCTSLTTLPELPATTLADECYLSMFEGCTSLTTLPELPATVLAQGCYSQMFSGCTGLTSVPSDYLPVTTLANMCYLAMFADCKSIAQAPELPATTLQSYCYYRMFSGCTSLNNVKCLATDISASHCTENWVKGVAARGTFVKNPSMNDWSTGVDGIPSNWTVIDNS